LIGAALFELDCFQDIGEDEGGPAERSRRFLIKAANKLRFYTERSSPWCLTFLMNFTISYTNRMFAPLVSGNIVRAVQAAFGEKPLQSQNATSKASARVEVLDADGTLFIRDSLCEYMHRPTHSKTRYLPIYLFTASWRFQRMTAKLKHRMLPQPGYNGAPLESDHDDNPIPLDELINLPAPSATTSTHGYLHCPGTVPYILGPKVPIQPDADATQAQKDYYALVILVLFKPFRSHNDLRGPDETWWDSWVNYRTKLNELTAEYASGRPECRRARYILDIIENFQCLAEGERDQRLLSKQREEAALAANLINLEFGDKEPLPREFDPFMVDLSDVEASLQFMTELNLKTKKTTVDASGRASEMLPSPLPLEANRPTIVARAGPDELEAGQHKAVMAELKEMVGAGAPTHRDAATAALELTTASARQAARETLAWPGPLLMDFPMDKPSVDEIINHPDLQLDARQSYAFRIYATYFFRDLVDDGEQHLIHPDDLEFLTITPPNKQLVMHIPGKAGVGKSRLIKAIQGLISAYGKDHWLLVGCFTGAAADNVGGHTLHSLFKIGDKFSAGVRDANRNIVLRPARCFILDEVSMCGGNVLGSSDKELGLAKGGNADVVFGGLSCIMLGDFAQLPPVGDSALTIYPCDQAESTKKGLRLWHEEINTVIALTTVHRVDDPVFLEVLDRLRWGKCGLADYKYMQTLIGTRELKPDFERLILVAGNHVRESLNKTLGAQHAMLRQSRILLSPATDTSGNRALPPAFQLELRAAPESECGLRAGWLPLICGGVYVLKRNMSPELGLSNSTRIVLRRILWKGDPPMYVDDPSLPPLQLSVAPEILVFETLASVLHAIDPVKHPDAARHKTISGFNPGEIPITISNKDFEYVRPVDIKKHGTKRKAPNYKLWRLQFPVLQAFASTVHGAQGLTLDQIVALVDTCTRYGSAYTMLTRTRTAAGNVILRDFDFKCLRKPPPIHVQTDWIRLQRLEEDTLRQWHLAMPHSLMPSNYGTPPEDRPASDLPPPPKPSRGRKRKAPATPRTPAQQLQPAPAVAALANPQTNLSFPVDVPLQLWSRNQLTSLLGLSSAAAKNLIAAGVGTADFAANSELHLQDVAQRFPALRPLLCDYGIVLASIASQQNRVANRENAAARALALAHMRRLQAVLAANGRTPVTEAWPFIVRGQGDCGPDSIAWLTASAYLRQNPGVWMPHRPSLSKACRQRVVAWMLLNGDTEIPGMGGLAFSHMVPTVTWPAQCHLLKQPRQPVDHVFLAAAACVHKCNIVVYTSDDNYDNNQLTFSPLDPSETTIHLGHTVDPAHFVPVVPS
jgi:hypothetical protein